MAFELYKRENNRPEPQIVICGARITFNHSCVKTILGEDAKYIHMYYNDCEKAIGIKKIADDDENAFTISRTSRCRKYLTSVVSPSSFLKKIPFEMTKEKKYFTPVWDEENQMTIIYL